MTTNYMPKRRLENRIWQLHEMLCIPEGNPIRPWKLAMAAE